jgi:hypothetical protein
VRRSRRRRWLVAVLVAAGVVVLLVIAMQYRTEARGVSDYIAVTEGAVELQAQAASDLESALLDLSSIDRPELLRRLDVMHTSVAEAMQSIEGISVPATAAEAHGYLMVATRSWEQALAGLLDAVVAVVDDGGTEADDALQNALILLRVGDTAYAEFLTRVGDFDSAIASGDYAPVAFAPSDGPVRFEPTTLANRLTTTYRLGSQHNISVTAVTDPAPIGERNNVPIVPDSETFVVQAVVANEGNETEELISVVLDLIATDTADEPVTITQTVASLAPGEAKTCIFDGLVLQGGALYELVINASTAGDDTPDDNAWHMVFYRNETA